MSDVDLVKEKIDIVDVISEYVPLKKVGRNFKALSPFRTEKTPSFIVSPDRQIFRDFGGDKGGDVITFVMEIENISFAEALQYLADKAGVKLSQKHQVTSEDREKDLIYAINHLTQQFYNYLLTSHKAGKEALHYITEVRGLPLALVNSFGIGYAPDATSLYTYLIRKKGYKIPDLEKAGVVGRYNGRTIDFFRKRIIFPITDVRGNVVAFSGRALDSKAQPKYINTRETLVYKKSQSLYGLFQAKEDIRRVGKVIVVEGELDVLSPRREGILNIVAAKGTALTEDHIKLLKRYAEKILFCFDQDPAGTEAQRRAIELLEKHGLGAGVIRLPAGKDPDELVNNDLAAFKSAVKHEVNIYDFIIDSAVEEFDTNSAEGKKKIIDKTLPMLSSIENEVVKEHFLRKLAETLGTTLSSIQKESERRTVNSKKEDYEKKNTKKETKEEYLLSCVLQSENISVESRKIIDRMEPLAFSNPGIQKLLVLMSEDKGNASEIAKKLPRELSTLFDEAYLRPIPEFKTKIELEREIEKAFKLVKKQAAKARMDEVALLLKDANGLEEEKLASEYTMLSKVLK